MAINLTKILNQVQDRINDSATTERDLDKLIKIADRINNSGVQVKTYGSTGQLPTISDSAYIGTIAYVSSDNVFGDSDGRFYYASGTDSGWRGFTTTQDSAEALIEAPSGGTTVAAMPFQGVAFGYAMGGYPVRNTIEKYPYTADGNSTDVSDLTGTKYYLASSTSTTHGYAHGGTSAPGSVLNVIEKLTFSTEGNATDVGNLTVARTQPGGTSGSTHGYAAGGTGPSTYVNVIDKYAFATDGNATDTGDLTGTRFEMGVGVLASDTNGYFSGGRRGTSPFLRLNVIEKFPFASDGNTTDTGDITVARSSVSNTSSNENGYTAGGFNPPYSDVIDKFPFSAEGDATDVGNLTEARRLVAGTMSTTHGYRHGGNNPNPTAIDKYSFSTDGNATDVGDLTSGGNGMGGTQV